ncbi:acyltransferase [Shewanella sp. S1-58-MNA-CIBAN-0166]|uniref:acyltransferase n=1 Tax=Shewanella sp. S1-58-MNA-CIBAN-0166 TaxID=3140467 RepID=UPI00332CBCE1
MMRFLRRFILELRIKYLKNIYGMNISKGVLLSSKCNLDKTNPKGVYIGEDSYIAFGATVLTHDFVRGFHADTKIGKKCFIGANSLILPGVKIGDNSIVAAGSIVTKSIPNNCIVAGNPAKVIRENIKTKKYGKLTND